MCFEVILSLNPAHLQVKLITVAQLNAIKTSPMSPPWPVALCSLLGSRMPSLARLVMTVYISYDPFLCLAFPRPGYFQHASPSLSCPCESSGPIRDMCQVRRAETQDCDDGLREAICTTLFNDALVWSGGYKHVTD